MAYSSILIGATHLVLIVLRLYETTWEIIAFEEPFNFDDIRHVLALCLIQILLIGCLIYGSIKKNYRYIVPWLVCTLPAFIASTIYALCSVNSEGTYQTIVNLICIVCLWTSWFLVYKQLNEFRLKSAYGSYMKLMTEDTEEETLKVH